MPKHLFIGGPLDKQFKDYQEIGSVIHEYYGYNCGAGGSCKNDKQRNEHRRKKWIPVESYVLIHKSYFI